MDDQTPVSLHEKFGVKDGYCIKVGDGLRIIGVNLTKLEPRGVKNTYGINEYFNNFMRYVAAAMPIEQVDENEYRIDPHERMTLKFIVEQNVLIYWLYSEDGVTALRDGIQNVQGPTLEHFLDSNFEMKRGEVFYLFIGWPELVTAATINRRSPLPLGRFRIFEPYGGYIELRNMLKIKIVCG